MKFIYKQNKLDYRMEEKLGTLLTLANGRFSIRGELELIPSRYGIFVSNVYDYAPVYYREIVNLPRPIGVYIIVNGEPLVFSKEAKYHIERILDINKGVLSTKITWERGGKKVLYESTRIVHKKNKFLAGLRFKIKTMGFNGKLTIISPIELDKTNPSFPEHVTIRHYKVLDKVDSKQGVGVIVETHDKKYRVGIASLLRPSGRNDFERIFIETGNVVGESIILDVNDGDEHVFTKYISVVRNIDVDNVLENALNVLVDALDKGWNTVYEEHVEAWESIWREIDLSIEGDPYAEKLLKFNAFHLLQLVDDEKDYIMIPARGLHGIGYRGHVFWDTDIYTLPFYTLIVGKAGRLVLNYRCNLLGKAIEYARSLGYNGARFPWECADDGYEAAPNEIPLDVLGKEKIPIYTGIEEEHITADIAFAVDYYYNATGDDYFMERCGLKIIFESARYWASRVKMKNGFYVLEKVMGPDEYHGHVNNSFYTNILVKKNMDLAIRYYYASRRKKKWLQVVRELGITLNEVNLWKEIRDKIYIPCNKDGFCEEFEGYMELKDYVIEDECFGEQCVPREILNRVEETKLVKQADVVAAMFILYDEFKKDVIRKNFEYYVKRTTHASSLSLPFYAGLAARLGLIDLAYKYFIRAAETDLNDIYGNTEHGFHVGAAGGVWYAFLHGFLGITLKNGEIKSIEPRLPDHWKRVSLNIIVGGNKKKVVVENKENVIHV
ncbi:glycoside hydrolase family 65 protein [Desulfurococcaceae archaeon MEX13E-LK6-19]|nr:glycoside hydrolase family 65 protein [Desulfurococcaceae archaeon MEX13E-LK6-19]